MAGLDYSAGCVNFRDVGEWLEVLVGDNHFLPIGRLLRGGKLDAVASPADVGSPRTILNVRRGPDRIIQAWGADWLHTPLPKVPSLASYDPHHRDIKKWLHRVLGILGNPATRYPVLVHCTSGKDRTGMVVAAVLAILEVQRQHITDEYSLSDGGVERVAIERFLDGIGDPAAYFDGMDRGAFRQVLRGSQQRETRR